MRQYMRQSIKDYESESRPLAIRARYQPESVGYSRLSFSKAFCSTISLPHVADQSFQLVLPIGEGTGGDMHCYMFYLVIFLLTTVKLSSSWQI